MEQNQERQMGQTGQHTTRDNWKSRNKNQKLRIWDQTRETHSRVELAPVTRKPNEQGRRTSNYNKGRSNPQDENQVQVGGVSIKKKVRLRINQIHTVRRSLQNFPKKCKMIHLHNVGGGANYYFICCWELVKVYDIVCIFTLDINNW